MSPAGRPAMRWPLPAELGHARRRPFVGREKELLEIEACWRTVRDGGGCAAMVGGEAGAGKTTLVSRLAGDVDGIVLYGRCDEDFALPYQPFVEALRRFVTDADDATVQRIPRSAAAELSPLVPVIEDRLPGLPPALQADSDATRFAFSNAVRTTLGVVGASAPTIVVLDDLHWASKPTLDLLRFVLTPTPVQGVMIVGTYRDTETQRVPALLDLLADLREHDAPLTRVGLGGLTTNELQELVSTLAAVDRDRDDHRTALALQSRTGGNPFFATELLALLGDQGTTASSRDLERVGVPDSVREVVGQRLDRLSDAVNEMLDVASVIGAVFSLSVLERALGRDHDVLELVEDAMDAGLVSELDAGEFQFGHALVRDTVRSRLTPSRVLRLHLLIADAVASASATPADDEVIAYHLCAASPLGDAERAATYALRAAQRLVATSGPDDAVSFAERGLAVLDAGRVAAPLLRADLHLVLAEARFRLADFEGRKAAAYAAAGDARVAGAIDRLALAAYWFGYYGEVGNLDDRVVSLCDEALAGLPSDAHGLRARVLNTLAANQALGGDIPSAQAMAVDAVWEARIADEPSVLHEALVTMHSSLNGSPSSAERLAITEEIIQRATAAGDRPGLAHGHRLRAIERLIRGDRAGFQADHETLTRLGTELNDHFMLAIAAQWRAMEALLSGEFDAVEALGAEALTISNNEPNFFNAYAAQLFWLHYEQGRLADFLPLLEDAAEHNPGIVGFQCALAMARAHIGEHDRAFAQFDGICRAGLDQIPFDWIRSVALAQLVEVAAVLGVRDHLDALTAALEPYASELIVVATGTQCVGAVDRYLGMAAATLGDHERARAWYDSALALETRIDAPPLVARTRHWMQQASGRVSAP